MVSPGNRQNKCYNPLTHVSRSHHTHHLLTSGQPQTASYLTQYRSFTCSSSLVMTAMLSVPLEPSQQKQMSKRKRLKIHSENYTNTSDTSIVQTEAEVNSIFILHRLLKILALKQILIPRDKFFLASTYVCKGGRRTESENKDITSER